MNFPARMNPKNPIQHAAQSMTVSASAALGAQQVLMACSSGGVRGSRGRDGDLGARLMPLTTYCRRGSAPGAKGSPWPAMMWKNRIADR